MVCGIESVSDRYRSTEVVFCRSERVVESVILEKKTFTRESCRLELSIIG